MDGDWLRAVGTSTIGGFLVRGRRVLGQRVIGGWLGTFPDVAGRRAKARHTVAIDAAVGETTDEFMGGGVEAEVNYDRQMDVLRSFFQEQALILLKARFRAHEIISRGQANACSLSLRHTTKIGRTT